MSEYCPQRRGPAATPQPQHVIIGYMLVTPQEDCSCDLRLEGWLVRFCIEVARNRLSLAGASFCGRSGSPVNCALQAGRWPAGVRQVAVVWSVTCATQQPYLNAAAEHMPAWLLCERSFVLWPASLMGS